MLTFGSGILNTAINKLPFELHIPGYQFCGPGTRLNERLAKGEVGINPLDEACKAHDIAYSQYPDLKQRHEADKILAVKAWDRAKTSSSIKERLAALAIAAAMKTKTKLGMGMRKIRLKKVGKGTRKSFYDVLRKARAASKSAKTAKSAIKLALKAARKVAKGRKDISLPRIIPVPKRGGFLPLIPIFAGLSALGALAGGASGIAKAVEESKASKADLVEKQRHNLQMEKIALGKGLFLKPYKKGSALILQPKNCRGGR